VRFVVFVEKVKDRQQGRIKVCHGTGCAGTKCARKDGSKLNEVGKVTRGD
jgi:hypothetical protein